MYNRLFKTNSLSIQESDNKSHHHSIGGGAVYASGSTSSDGSHSHYIGYGADSDSGWGTMYQGTSAVWSPVYTSTEGSHTHSVGVNVPDHSHTCDYRGTDESRPNNYTYIIWKRIN